MEEATSIIGGGGSFSIAGASPTPRKIALSWFCGFPLKFNLHQAFASQIAKIMGYVRPNSCEVPLSLILKKIYKTKLANYSLFVFLEVFFLRRFFNTRFFVISSYISPSLQISYYQFHRE
jgi:hypothetical protein